jgi:ribosomal protein S18 acetylase RimI-like enzyme
VIDLDDGASLRRATLADLAPILAIKRALPMPSTRETHTGGFLLGSDEHTYAQLLAVGRVWLLACDDRPVGFSVTLDDPILRRSPVWARRALIDWDPSFDPEPALGRRIAYFDQLAVLPSLRSRYWGAALALRALSELIDELAHELVLTTTVIEPIVNRAALPYLARVGAQQVGRIDEHYGEVGYVRSAIHLIEAQRYREHIGRMHAAGQPATRRVIESSFARAP